MSSISRLARVLPMRGLHGCMRPRLKGGMIRVNAIGIDRGARTVSHPPQLNLLWEGVPAMSIKGKSYIVGIYEHPTRLAQDKTVPMLHAECAKGALEDAGPQQERHRRLFLRRRRHAGSRRLVDRGLPRPEAAAHRFDRHRRLVVPVAGRACRRGDRGREMLGGADHAGRPSSRRRHGDRHRAARARGADAGIGLRAALCAGHGEHVRDVRDAAHARVRHDQRADGLGQGRRLAPCAAQSARDAARRRDGRGCRQFADDRRPAAPARLLRHQRRRRRDDHDHAGNREKPEAAIGQGDRGRRGAEAPDGRQGRSDLFRRGVVGAGGVRRGRGQAVAT